MNAIKTNSLKVEHVFDATQDELWDAWTNPRQFEKWYNPSPGMDLVIQAFDVRVGGRIHFDMPMPGGRGGNTTRGIFHVVKPKTHLVFGAEDKSSLNDVTLKAEGRKTRVTVIWTSTMPAMGSPEMQKMATMAWKSSAGKLERLFQGQGSNR